MAPRMTASAPSRDQVLVHATTPPAAAGSTVAMVEQDPSAASDPDMASKAPDLVPSTQVSRALVSSPTEPLTQTGQKQLTPLVETLQAPARQAPVQPDNFASIKSSQATYVRGCHCRSSGI